MKKKTNALLNFTIVTFAINIDVKVSRGSYKLLNKELKRHRY